MPRGRIAQKFQALFVQMFGNDGSNWLADHFFGRVAVELLRTFVPGHDDPREISAEDRIVGARLDDSEAVFFGPGAGLVSTDHGIPLRIPNWRTLATVRYAA